MQTEMGEILQLSKSEQQLQLNQSHKPFTQNNTDCKVNYMRCKIHLLQWRYMTASTENFQHKRRNRSMPY